MVKFGGSSLLLISFLVVASILIIECADDVPIAADLKNTPCAPNDYFQLDCNTCYCNIERTGYLCTENPCDEPHSSTSTTTESASEKNVLDNNLSRIPEMGYQQSLTPMELIPQGVSNSSKGGTERNGTAANHT